MPWGKYKSMKYIFHLECELRMVDNGLEIYIFNIKAGTFHPKSLPLELFKKLKIQAMIGEDVKCVE